MTKGDAEAERKRRKEYKKLYFEKLKADPERHEEYLRKARERTARNCAN